MDSFNRVDAILRAAAEAKKVPGVVAIASSENATLYEGAYGKRDLTQDTAMTLDSVFWIASMTKAITSAGAMQLVEQGKLDLDAPIGTLLPELADPKVLEGFDESGAPKLRNASRPITLRHLMTHTAGFAYDMWNGDLVRYMEHTQTPGIVSCQHQALTTPLMSDPGTRWEYGINIDFVGKAVEAASGQKLGAYLKTNIFDPLGMKDTAFKMGESQRARLVGMHARQADGSFEAMPFEVPQEPEFEMGGGGLYGTAPDYIAFIRMLLNDGSANGQQILRPETVRTMGQNQMGDLNVTKMTSALAPYTNDVDLYPDQEKKWGLSFLINTKKTAEGRNPGSLAWAGLANTYFWLDPSAKVGGVVLTQLLPFGDPTVLELLGTLERGVYGTIAGANIAAE